MRPFPGNAPASLGAVVVATTFAWAALGVVAARTQGGGPATQSLVSAEPPTAEFYLRRGENFVDAHDCDRAIADYDAALRLKPDFAEAYNDRGHAYYWRALGGPAAVKDALADGVSGDRHPGDMEQAIADFTRAIALRPDYPNAFNNRGAAYMASGDRDRVLADGEWVTRAVADFSQAIALQPDFRNAYVNRANALVPWHPWRALEDFHQAGMYPERTVVVFGSVVIGLGIAGRMFVVKRRRNRTLRRRLQ